MQRSEKMEDYIDKVLVWTTAFIVCGIFSAIILSVLLGRDMC